MKPKIENLDQALDWARRANEVCSTKVRVELQDEFARSDVKTLEGIIRQAIDKDHRRLFLFGIYKIMGDEWLSTYIRLWAITVANRHIEREAEILDKRHGELFEKEKKLQIREQAINEHRKPIYKKFRAMQNIIDRQTKNLLYEYNRNVRLGDTISELRKTVRDLEFELTKRQDMKTCFAMMHDILKREGL